MEEKETIRVMIEVPIELGKQLDIKDQQLKMVTIDKDNLKIPLDTRNKESYLKLRWVLLPTILSTLFFIGMNLNQNTITFTGEHSVASYVIILGTILTFVLFTIFFSLGKTGKIQSNNQNIYWRNFFSILISIGLIMVIVLLVLFNLVEQLFLGLSFDLLTASFLFSIIIGGISYLVINIALTITFSTLINILMIIAIGGVSIAMLTNREQQWWLNNLSFLGSNLAASSWRFNLTLVLASLIMIALIDFLFEAIFQTQTRSNQLKATKIILILLAVFLGGVGLFPYNENVISQSLHNFFAEGLVVWVLILMVGTRWLIPNADKHFLKLTNGLGFLLIIVTLLFKVVQYLSLTAFEIIAFIIAFFWLLLLLQKLIELSNYGSKTYPIRLTLINNKPMDNELQSPNC